MPDGGSFLHGMFFEPADMERPLKMPLLCHYVYMKMPITTCYKKTFIVDNQLDRDFYIRGRHEGADNSLCKS